MLTLHRLKWSERWLWTLCWYLANDPRLDFGIFAAQTSLEAILLTLQIHRTIVFDHDHDALLLRDFLRIKKRILLLFQDILRPFLQLAVPKWKDIPMKTLLSNIPPLFVFDHSNVKEKIRSCLTRNITRIGEKATSNLITEFIAP